MAASYSSLRDWLSKFDRARLLALIARLQLSPGNQFHLIRLERAAQVAASLQKGGKGVPSLPELVRRLNGDRFLAEIKSFQDPPENLFTENIVFFGGNYLVYPGIADGVAFSLRHLLEGLFFDSKIDEQFRSLVARSVRAILTLSNHLATTLGQERWMDSPGEISASIVQPPAALTALSEAPRFTAEQMHELMTEVDLSITDVDPFVLLPEQISLSDAAKIDDHPLQARPIVRIGSDYVIALPCALTSAARRFIVVLAKASETLAPLMRAFQSSVQNATFESLRIMGFRRVPGQLPPASKSTGALESVWQFDDEKLCHLQVIVDDGIDYDEANPFGAWNGASLASAVDDRNKQIAQFLTAEAPRCRQSLLLVVYAGIGRSGGFPISTDLPAGFRPAVIEAESLEIFSHQRQAGNTSLSLWKFFQATDRASKVMSVSQGSFLDRYGLYHRHHRSFYLGDDAPPNLVMVEVGYGRYLRVEAARAWDAHAVPSYEENRLTTVVCRYDQEIPIFVPLHGVGRRLESMVEGYRQTWWVRANTDENERRHALMELVDAVAYWLWQLAPGLADLLARLGPMVGRFDVTADDEFFSGQWPIAADLGTPPAFAWEPQVDASARIVHVALPKELLLHLAAPQNEGERILLDYILRSLAELGRQLGVPLDLGDDTRSRLIEEAAPLGLKKKFFVLDGRRRPELIPWAGPHFRYVDDHDVEAELDGLAIDVLGRTPPGALPTEGAVPKASNKLLFDAILGRYVDRLRASIGRFEALSLLRRLVAETEAITYQVAFTEFTGPLAAACFRDTVRQAQHVAEEMPKLNRAAIALRFLVEFVTAEPPRGDRTPSDQDVDELLGLSYGYFYWGMLGDEIRCRIVDRPLHMLKSGRVGVDRSMGSWGTSFMSAKSLEALEDRTRGFARGWNPTAKGPKQAGESDTVVAEADVAFRAEFGFSLDDLARVGAAVQSIGFRAERGEVTNLEATEAVRQVREHAELEESQVTAVLSAFTLSARTTWDDPPPGFNRLDVLPWHFNRRLSFIRRSIVRWEDPASGEHRLIWGPRHFYRSVTNLLEIVLSGRYKMEHCRSDQMREFTGRIVDERGDAFEKTLVAFFRSTSEHRAEPNVQIGPGKRLEASEDLGDVDVFLFHKHRRVAYACECKDILFGRTPAELAGELDRLFRGDPKKPKEPSRAAMHLKRVTWLAANWKQVSTTLGLAKGSWTLVPVMVLEAEIPSPYIIDPPLPVVPFSTLQRDGVAVLEPLSRRKAALRCKID